MNMLIQLRDISWTRALERFHGLSGVLEGVWLEIAVKKNLLCV